MEKLAYVMPVIFLAVGIYLVLLTMGAGEIVEIFPGHEIPDRLCLMLAAVAFFGAIAVGVEAYHGNKQKKELPPTGDRHS